MGRLLINLLWCLVFPIFALWYGPKYVLRKEYVRAALCVGVAVVPAIVLALLVL